MAPFIFWNLAFYTIIRTQLKKINSINGYHRRLKRKIGQNRIGHIGQFLGMSWVYWEGRDVPEDSGLSNSVFEFSNKKTSALSQGAPANSINKEKNGR
ncbi:hypothetical protein [Paenibacillus larvae]|nr:hypothetical protein [Paenibacillus larvae]MDR5584253.1 hypothetical protein [Paenibacillus larvae]